MENIIWVVVIIIINIIHFFLILHNNKRFLKKHIELIEEKSRELEEAIDNADMMLNELNNISDYVVSRTEESQKLFMDAAENLKQKIIQCQELLDSIHKDYAENSEKPVADSKGNENNKQANNNIYMSLSKNHDMNSSDSIAQKMYQEGMSVREIARELNRGQGEIELLLGIKKKK